MLVRKRRMSTAGGGGRPEGVHVKRISIVIAALALVATACGQPQGGGGTASGSPAASAGPVPGGPGPLPVREGPTAPVTPLPDQDLRARVRKRRVGGGAAG